MIKSIDISTEDRKKGIVAYLGNVVHCRICDKPTNLLYEIGGFTVIACSKECAVKRAIEKMDKIMDKRGKRYEKSTQEKDKI